MFNKLEKTIPPELRDRVKSESHILLGFDSLTAQDLETVFFVSPQSLAAHLINNLGYKSTDRLIVFHDYSSGRQIYYDFNTGARLGDDIGINDWLAAS